MWQRGQDTNTVPVAAAINVTEQLTQQAVKKSRNAKGLAIR
jgi:hypothetical protein